MSTWNSLASEGRMRGHRLAALRPIAFAAAAFCLGMASAALGCIA